MTDFVQNEKKFRGYFRSNKEQLNELLSFIDEDRKRRIQITENL